MKKAMTVAEGLAALEADPAFVERRARQDAEMAARVAQRKIDEAPLVRDLGAAGFDVQSVWELVNTAEKYDAALPILLEHLQRPYPRGIREGIARALAVPEAAFAWDVLMRLYQEESDRWAKDGLAVALSGAASDATTEDVIALARDARNGPSRVLLLSALERSADPASRATLMELGTDPEVSPEVQVILRRLKRRKRPR
jgi:hypothetical protein